MFLFTSHWKKPSVFISYKYSEKGNLNNTYKIALALEKALKEHHFKVALQQYVPNVQHDMLNHTIKQSLRKTDAVIVVPDLVHPSYVNAEIFAAYYADKPLYIIKYADDQRLPDTANSGHPVFLFQKLKKYKYLPVMEVLSYVHHYWATQFFLFIIPIDNFLMLWADLTDDDYMFRNLSIGGVIIIGLMIFNAPIWWVLLTLQLITVYIGAFCTFKTLKQYRYKLHLRNIARQSIIDVINTPEQFNKGEFSKEVIECLSEIGQLIKPVTKKAIT